MQSHLQLALFSNLADLECGTPSLEIGMCLQIGQRFIENSLISNEECTILPASFYIGAKADRPRQSTVDTRKSRTTLDKWIDNGEGFNSREVSGSGKRWAW